MSKRKKIEKSPEVNHLVKIATLFQPLVSSKMQMNEEANKILFLKDKAAVYNGQQLLIYKHKFGFEGAVIAKDFVRIIKKLSEEIFNIEKEGNILKLKTPKQTIEFNIEEVKDKTKSNINGVTKKEKTFDKIKIKSMVISGIISCATTTTKDISQGYLDGVYADKNSIISADNHRISYYQDKEIKLPKLFMSQESASFLVYLPNSVSHYAHDSNVVYFFGENYIYATVTKDSATKEFPKKKIIGLFPEKSGRKIVMKTGEVITALQTALVFIDDVPVSEKVVELTISKTDIKITVVKEGRGTFSQRIKVKNKVDDEVSVKVNPIFLLEGLDFMGVKLYLAKKHLLLTNNDNFKHMIKLR